MTASVSSAFAKVRYSRSRGYHYRSGSWPSGCTPNTGRISSVQLARDIGVTQKTAWHMLHRLRKASTNMPQGLLSGVVEADETYIGDKEGNKHESRKNRLGRGSAGKAPGYASVDNLPTAAVGVKLPYAELIR